MDDFDPDKVKIDVGRGARWNALTLPYLFERGGLDPARPAIVCGDATRTYGELRDRARRVGNGLIGLGIEPMDRVALLAENRLEYFEVETGIAAARAIMVPLNWRLRAGELAQQLRRAEVRAIFADATGLETVAALRADGELPELEIVIALDGDGGDVAYETLCAEASAERPPRAGRLDDPHEIIFTSGTTGEPKGVVWTNGGVMFNSLQQVVDFRMGPGCSAYSVIDLYYIGGRHDFGWSTLHAGGTLHVKPSGNFDATTVIDYVCANAISHILWVPTMLYDILRLEGIDERDTRCLQMIMCGGQVVSRATTERAQEAFPETDFIQVYGLTEGGGSVTFIPAADARARPGSAGKPSMHAEVKLVDTDGAEVGTDADGEILVRAPSVTAGYWDDPERTAESITPDGWLRTGDMGRFDADGYLTITGRKRDLIVTGGMNVFPAEVEDLLSRYEGVAGVAVIGLPHERWGETVCAVLELAPGAEIDEAAVIAHCAEHLAGYKKPTSIEVVDEIPRTVSGKPQKFALQERFADRQEQA